MKDRWSQLSMSEKSDLMSLYIKNGISSLEEIKKHYNSYQIGGLIPSKTPNFVQRFNEGNKRDIPVQGGHATHLLSYAERDGKYYVYPEVQPTDYNNSNSPLQYYGRDWRVAFDRAYDNNDYLEFDTEEAARNYSENYKKVPSTGAVLNGRNRGNYNILDYMRGYATGGQMNGPDDPPNPRVGVVGIDVSLMGSAATHAKPLQPIMQNYNEEMARSRGNSYTGTKGDEIKRKLLNDTPTAHESQDMEDAMHKALYPWNMFGESPRVSNKLKYTIPYIYDKEIKINGHRTSENVLDTLYKYSQETGLPFVDALGLAGQETGYGSMPFMNIVNEDNGFDLFTGLTAKEENRILANTNYFRNYGVIPANNLVRDFAWERGTDMTQHPLIHAFNYFKAGKYNPRDPQHSSDVRRTGERALSTSAVQDWMERNGITFATGGHLYQDGGPVKVGNTPPPIDYSLEGNNIEEPFYRPNDPEYIKYWNTLPDNQRLTSNDKYDSYMYWKCNGRPRNFQEARRLGMFTYDHSDNSYHANSIAYDDAGNGRFMKPKNHSTVKYELDYYNKGLVTEEGGYQRQLNNEERKDWENFRKEYELVNDPERPNFYMYRRRSNGGSLGKVTPYGQWKYPGEVTTIPSNNITMKGVNYPVIGVSNTGDTKYMLPNMDYLFEGQYVTEYPAKRK